jgi:hypothetical protein
MKLSEEFPTVFARVLGEKCGLLLSIERDRDYKKQTDLKERMVWFQQMSITASFEDCCMAYVGISLSAEQLEVLKLIYQSTKPWITGHIVGVLMSRINDDRAMNKDFAEAVRVLVEQSKAPEGTVSKKMQGIMVKSTQRERLARESQK